jgi:uncharacterized protein (TIGR03067 family)
MLMALTGVSLLGLPGKPGDSEEKGRLEGTWSAVAILDKDGKRLAPNDSELARLWLREMQTWVFTGKTGAFHDSDGRETGFIYQINRSQTPNTIDLIFAYKVEKGEKRELVEYERVRGIFRVEGDTLKLAWVTKRADGKPAERPLEFKASWKGNAGALELKREKAKEK